MPALALWAGLPMPVVVGTSLLIIVLKSAAGFAGFVLAMASFILVREGTLLVTTVGPALPNTLAQLSFSVVMLSVGVLAGRASRSVNEQLAESTYDQGAGIRRAGRRASGQSRA